MKEQFKAIFNGRDTVFSCYIKQDGKTIFIKKPHKYFPFLSRWHPLLSNVGEHMREYEEKSLIKLDEGRTDNKVRIFPIDLDTFERNFADMNLEYKREMQSLRAERNFLYLFIKDIQENLRTAGQYDLIKRKMKDEFNFYTGLKPQYLGHDPNKQKEKKK